MFSIANEIRPPRPGRQTDDGIDPHAAAIENADGRGSIVVLCDHASNRLPPRYGMLGLSSADLERHIAWDPGALGVARALARRLDSVLAFSTVSRLVIDCNRDPSAIDSITTIGETTPIPGNSAVDEQERARRVRDAYEPFHAAASSAIERAASRGPVAVVSVHSFTPVFKGVARPWHVGILFDRDERLARPLLAQLSCEKGLVVGANEPYSPKDRVYHTLDRHAQRRGLPSVMIEIRNDLIETTDAQDAWGARLAEALGPAFEQALSMTGGDNTKTAGAA